MVYGDSAFEQLLIMQKVKVGRKPPPPPLPPTHSLAVTSLAIPLPQTLAAL